MQSMNEYNYQRQVIAYHGCDRPVADKVLLESLALAPSEKKHDWLGKGIYFWEHGPQRAFDWAVQRQNMGKISEPAVVGAFIQLGNCFDLLDTRYTEALHRMWPFFVEARVADAKSIPANRSSQQNPEINKLLRYRDCAVINWTLAQLEESEPAYDSVRGVFQEDEPVYDGSEIRLKSHIQIAIRNPACIIGYFRPSYV